MPAKERKLTKSGVARKVRSDKGKAQNSITKKGVARKVRAGGKGSRTFAEDTVTIGRENAEHDIIKHDIKVRNKPLKSKSNFIKSGQNLVLKFKSGDKTPLIEGGETRKAFTVNRLNRLKKEGVVIKVSKKPQRGTIV
jgi:hypothetical protein